MVELIKLKGRCFMNEKTIIKYSVVDIQNVLNLLNTVEFRGIGSAQSITAIAEILNTKAITDAENQTK